MIESRTRETHFELRRGALERRFQLILASARSRELLHETMQPRNVRAETLEDDDLLLGRWTESSRHQRKISLIRNAATAVARFWPTIGRTCIFPAS